MERRGQILKLRKAHKTYEEIGSIYGISRERVRQIAGGKPRSSNSDLDSKVMLTASDAARLLGIHVNTVRRWTNQGILRAYRICSRGDRRYRREDIDRFLKERQMGLGETERR